MQAPLNSRWGRRFWYGVIGGVVVVDCVVCPRQIEEVAETVSAAHRLVPWYITLPFWIYTLAHLYSKLPARWDVYERAGVLFPRRRTA